MMCACRHTTSLASFLLVNIPASHEWTVMIMPGKRERSGGKKIDQATLTTSQAVIGRVFFLLYFLLTKFIYWNRMITTMIGRHGGPTTVSNCSEAMQGDNREPLRKREHDKSPNDETQFRPLGLLA